MSMDVALWLILSITENTRSVRPTARVSFRRDERDAIARSQGRRCNYCGARLTRDNLQIDHMDPVSRGGSNDWENLQALCRRCNIRKGNHTDEEFRERYVEILDAYAPPRMTIPQRMFDSVTRTTRAHQNVREANRNRYQSPRARVYQAMPAVAIFWWILWVLISYFWLPGLVSLAFLGGPVFGVAYAFGLWFRAKHAGVFDEEME